MSLMRVLICAIPLLSACSVVHRQSPSQRSTSPKQAGLPVDQTNGTKDVGNDAPASGQTGAPTDDSQFCSILVDATRIEPGFEAFPGLADKFGTSTFEKLTGERCAARCNTLAEPSVGFTRCNYRCDFGSQSLLTASAKAGTCSGVIASAPPAGQSPSGGSGTNPLTSLGSCTVKTAYGVFDGRFIGSNNFSGSTESRENCRSVCAQKLSLAKANSNGSGCSFSCDWKSEQLVVPYSNLNVCSTPAL
jgi:hypothetical protein